jgi:hypothetical protein
MKHALILTLFFLGFLFLHRNTVFEGPYGYDEADYMYAARFGLAANFTDSPTMPIANFIATGLNRGRDPGSRADLSQTIRNSNDIVFYRHWHGPLYYYWLCAIDALHLDERSVRLAGITWFALAGVVIYFGALLIVPGTAGPCAATLSLAMFLGSRTVIGSPELAPHALFALCSLMSLVLLVKAVETGRRTYWYAAVTAAAGAFAAIEMAFVLILTLAICAYGQRKQWSAGLRFILNSILVFVGTATLLWPGALIKLSFIKAYFFMAYLALFRKSPWGDTTFFQTWTGRFAASPVEWILIAVGIVLFIRHRNRRLLRPIAIFCGLMLLATLRVNTSEPRYGLMFGPELDLLAACALALSLDSQPAAKRIGILFLLCGALFLSGFFRSRAAATPDPRGPALLAFIREHQLGDKTLLVPQGDVPMLHYYFPRMHLYGLVDDRGNQDRPFVDGVLHPGFPIRYRPY